MKNKYVYPLLCVLVALFVLFSFFKENESEKAVGTEPTEVSKDTSTKLVNEQSLPERKEIVKAKKLQQQGASQSGSKMVTQRPQRPQGWRSDFPDAQVVDVKEKKKS